MSAPGTVPSPWGEPARMPAVTAAAPRTSPGPEEIGTEEIGLKEIGLEEIGLKGGIPRTRRTVDRWEDPGRWERARAAATLAVVAIILGAAAAGVLGVSVWAIAALFHHAASG